MLKIIKRYLLLLAMVLLMTTGGLVACDEGTSEAPPAAGELDEIEGEAATTFEEGQDTIAPNAGPAVVTASSLIGLDVVDGTGEKTAEVRDVFFDYDGNIRYMVFHDLERDEVDGVLSPVAVEWDARARYWDSIAVPVGAEGPAITTHSSLQNIEERLDLDEALLEPDDLFFEAGANVGKELEGLLQLSAFAGFDLFDTNLLSAEGEDIGEIDDLLVDLNSGEVVYALIDISGFLGVDARNIPVPWSRITFDEASRDFVVDVDEQALEGAPIFELEDLSDDAQPFLGIDGWDADLRGYWDDF